MNSYDLDSWKPLHMVRLDLITDLIARRCHNLYKILGLCICVGCVTIMNIINIMNKSTNDQKIINLMSK